MLKYFLATILVSMSWVGGRTLISADLTYPFPESSLSGVVTSEKGEPLEGILVRAKQDGVNKARVVVTDAQGKYRFPKLESGKYRVEIARADGMEEPSRDGIEIRSNQESHQDFKIGPAKDIEAHLSSADWLRNLPGTPEQRSLIDRECLHCHTGTPMKFRFDKEGWLKIARTMRYNGGERGGEEALVTPNREKPGWEETNQVIAEYLAKVRGPEPLKWDAATTKILPRPTGRSTRIMYTEYVIPYDNAELHDIKPALDGKIWWTDWRWPYVGMLNPETGEMKYWESPQLPGKKSLAGSEEIGFDKDGNLWTNFFWDRGLIKFDTKAEKFSTWEYHNPDTWRLGQNGMDNQRGRVWFSAAGLHGTTDNVGYYVPATGEYQIFKDFRVYGIVVDSQGNFYGMEGLRGRSQISRIDAETGVRTNYLTPTQPAAFPRRGDYDAQDRIWFAEYNANQIGMLDPKAGKITEYKMPHSNLSYPYGCGVDRVNDIVWVEQYRADRYAVLNPKTGEMWEYVLPERWVMSRSPQNARGSGRPGYGVMWAGTLPKYGNGKLIKMEAWY